MSNEVTGIIQEIRKKNVAGGKTAYDIVVGGEAYGNGLYPPKAVEGDYVKFEVDLSRAPYKNVARNSLKVSKGKPPAEAVAAAAATAPQISSTGASFDARQDSIVRQSSTEYAVAYLGVLAQAGALAVPTTKGKGQEYMDTLLSKYIQTFYEANTGLKWKSIRPGADKEEDAGETPDEAAPEDDNWA
jgi:hypothetical protein